MTAGGRVRPAAARCWALLGARGVCLYFLGVGVGNGGGARVGGGHGGNRPTTARPAINRCDARRNVWPPSIAGRRCRARGCTPSTVAAGGSPTERRTESLLGNSRTTDTALLLGPWMEKIRIFYIAM